VQFSTLPFYWSATTYAFFANEAWIVAFNDGRVDIDETRATDFVWCVRGGQGVDPQ
jgi:hypothetical protein